MECADSVPDIQFVGDSRSDDGLGLALIDIFETSVNEHTFPLAIAQILVTLEALVSGIFAELVDSHAQFIIEELSVVVIAGRCGPFGVVSAFPRLTVIGIVAETGGNSPPIHVTGIMPMGVLSARETKYDFIASLVVPVECGIPTVGHDIRTVLAVQKVLRIGGAIGEMILADINLGIEIQTHEQCGCGGLGELSLGTKVATE